MESDFREQEDQEQEEVEIGEINWAVMKNPQAITRLLLKLLKIWKK